MTETCRKEKTGAAKLAIEANVPVLPIGLINTDKVLPRGKFFPRFRRCDIKIGKPLHFNYAKNPDEKVIEATTSKIMKEIAKLTNKTYNY